jgi:alkanesulfonate monooxygenase SsuD/methylene tetrahydromethanopterin reductase-like flavin-dependent oxidoreductase (luciferase family)
MRDRTARQKCPQFAVVPCSQFAAVRGIDQLGDDAHAFALPAHGALSSVLTPRLSPMILLSWPAARTERRLRLITSAVDLPGWRSPSDRPSEK